MHRALVWLLLVGLLSMMACAAIPRKSMIPTATAAITATPLESASNPGAPAVLPESGAPISVSAAQQGHWYPRGIGLPLTTDDPALKDKKVAVLTFDDGPSTSDSTARILDALKEQNVKAMFFVTGAAFKHRDLVERMHREGHVVGPHSMTHANLTRLQPAEVREEIEPLNGLIESVTGAKPKYLRPPYGAYNPDVQAIARELGLELINWTDGSLDWQGPDIDGYKDPKVIVADVLRQLHRGAIVLMHDTKRHTADALPEVIRRIRAEGYEFVVLR